MAIIASTTNTQVYIEILDNFLILSVENWFGNDEVIFRMMTYLVTEKRGLKLFLKFFFKERHIISTTCPLHNLDLNPIENLWRKKKVHGSTPPSKENLFSDIWESWNLSDEEHYLKLMKFTSERIKSVIKV